MRGWFEAITGGGFDARTSGLFQAIMGGWVSKNMHISDIW